MISYDLLNVFIIWHWAQISDESYMSWIFSKQLDFSFFFSNCLDNIYLLSFYYLLMFPHSFRSLFSSSEANKSKSFWFSILIFHNYDRSSFSTIREEIFKLVFIPLWGKILYIDVCILVQLFVFVKSFNDDLFSRKFRLIQFIYCFKSLLFISKFHIPISVWWLLNFRLVARKSLWHFTANYFANFSEIWVEIWIVNKLLVQLSNNKIRCIVSKLCFIFNFRKNSWLYFVCWLENRELVLIENQFVRILLINYNMSPLRRNVCSKVSLDV